MLCLFVQTRLLFCINSHALGHAPIARPGHGLHMSTSADALHQATSIRLIRHGNGGIVDVDAAPFVVVAVGLEMA